MRFEITEGSPSTRELTFVPEVGYTEGFRARPYSYQASGDLGDVGSNDPDGHCGMATRSSSPPRPQAVLQHAKREYERSTPRHLYHHRI